MRRACAVRADPSREGLAPEAARVGKGRRQPGGRTFLAGWQNVAITLADKGLIEGGRTPK